MVSASSHVELVLGVGLTWTRLNEAAKDEIDATHVLTEEEPKKPLVSKVAGGALKVGDTVRQLELSTIKGSAVRIPDGERLVHIQFRRYAGCPFCNLHIRSFVRRHDEIVSAGVREVVVFYSEVKTMLEFQGDLPFAAVADPNYHVYEEFGARRTMSPLLRLNPRAWVTIINTLIRVDTLRGMEGKGEDRMGLPSEFLIGRDGKLLAVKYGKRVDDHWSVDQLLELVRLNS